MESMWVFYNPERRARPVISFFSMIVAMFTIVMVIFTIFSIKTSDKYGSSFNGYRLFVVLSDSMSPTDKNADLDIHFSAGDIVVTKELTDEEKLGLKEGDVISFVSSNTDSYDKVITHMIREVKYDSKGRVMGYTTYGTATGANDEAMARIDNVLGNYDFCFRKVGELFLFVKTPAGYLTCIFIPFVVLICWYGLKILRLLRYM